MALTGLFGTSDAQYGNLEYAKVPSSGAPNYTLALGSGTYVITGNAATLKRTIGMALASGTYAITGRAATLSHGYKLALASGTYAITGRNLTANISRGMALASGSYVITGRNATLNISRAMALASGTYVITGRNAALTIGRGIALGKGTYVISGQNATLVVTPVGGVAYTLALASGSYVLTGYSAALTVTAVNVGAKNYSHGRKLTKARARSDELATKYNRALIAAEQSERQSIVDVVQKFVRQEEPVTAETLPYVEQIDFEAMAKRAGERKLFLEAVNRIIEMREEEEEFAVMLLLSA